MRVQRSYSGTLTGAQFRLTHEPDRERRAVKIQGEQATGSIVACGVLAERVARAQRLAEAHSVVFRKGAALTAAAPMAACQMAEPRMVVGKTAGTHSAVDRTAQPVVVRDDSIRQCAR